MRKTPLIIMKIMSQCEKKEKEIIFWIKKIKPGFICLFALWNNLLGPLKHMYPPNSKKQKKIITIIK